MKKLLLTFITFYASIGLSQCIVDAPIPNNDCYYATIMADPWCCDNSWDGLCQSRYNNCTNSNCTVIPPNNITLNSCYYYVLSVDPWCCNNSWDYLCQIRYDNCIPIDLPIELKYLSGHYENNTNIISWATVTERDNDYFTLQHSADGVEWFTITKTPGAGTTNQEQFYSYKHKDFTNGVNYYRLSQTDYDGTTETFDIISISNTSYKKVKSYYNLLGQEVQPETKGVLIVVYEDGTMRKTYNE